LYDHSLKQLTGRTAISFPLHTGVFATWASGGNSPSRILKATSIVTKEGIVLLEEKPFFLYNALFLTATNAIVLKELSAARYKRTGSAHFYNGRDVDADNVAL
jgi:hypothetical protein